MNETIFLIRQGVQRRILTSFLTFAVVVFAGVAIADDPSGFISGNQADLPPVLDKDLSSQSTNPDLAPAYGPEDAKVIVVTFADFECPACRRSSQATHQIANQFPGEVRMEFRNNPLSSHATAYQAAQAALAAHQQGKFWEMHDLLFANLRHDPETLEQHALALGLDLDQFKKDMHSEETRKRVDADIALAEAVGARRTPGFLVNGKLIDGWSSWQYFKNRVGREVATANQLAAQGLSTSDILEQRAIDNNTDSTSYGLYHQSVLEPLTK